MATTTLSLRVQPYRLLTKTEAAYYCRRTVKKFEIQCPVKPIEMTDGDRLWDVQDLDHWINGLKTGTTDEAEQALARL
jgi:hypothetical protein